MNRGEKLQLDPVGFEAHNGLPINHCQFINSDKIIVTCSDDKTAGFWDSENTHCIFKLQSHKHFVKDFAINETKHNIITVSLDKSAINWDYNTVQQLWTLKHDSLLTSCDTSYDLTVTGCDNHNFYLVDTRIGNIVDTSKGKKGHSNTITCCKISPNGIDLCTCSMDRTAIVWDLRMLKKILKFNDHSNVLNSCSFSSNNHYLCTCSWDKTINVYDINSGTYRRCGPTTLDGHEGTVSQCTFSTDDSILVSCGYDQNVILWNVDNFELIGILRSGGDSSNWIHGIDLSRNKKIAVTCSKNGFIRLWNTEAATKVYKKKQIGLNMAKCDQCDRQFSYTVGLQSTCVFCRLGSPQNIIEALTASS